MIAAGAFSVLCARAPVQLMDAVRRGSKIIFIIDIIGVDFLIHMIIINVSTREW